MCTTNNSKTNAELVTGISENRLVYQDFFFSTMFPNVVFILAKIRIACNKYTTRFQVLKTLLKMSLENIVRKGENAGNQHCLLFPQCFLSFQTQTTSFIVTFNLSSAKSFNLV